MSVALTNASIIQYVKYMLGYPVIEVELTDDQINEAISQALGLYSRYKPIEVLKIFSVTQGLQKYEFTQDEIGRGIIELFIPSSIESNTSLDEFDIFHYNRLNLPNLSPGDYLLEKVWWNEVKVSVGAVEEWEWFPNNTDGGTLFINPPPPRTENYAAIYIKNAVLSEVPQQDDSWFKDYSLAFCKQILGVIRSKFNDVQGAESSISMDGDNLRTEGAAERQVLEEQLYNRGQTCPPIRG